MLREFQIKVGIKRTGISQVELPETVRLCDIIGSAADTQQSGIPLLACKTVYIG